MSNCKKIQVPPPLAPKKWPKIRAIIIEFFGVWCMLIGTFIIVCPCPYIQIVFVCLFLSLLIMYLR